MSFRDLALQAIHEVADSPTHVGEFLDRDLIDDATVLRFEATHPGYPFWRWCVALTGDDAHASVNEVWMEPGEGALAIPVWKPWSERIRPGDLGAGDVVETDPRDPRLTAGYTGIADVDGAEAPLHPLQWQLGLGRERVLSPEGLADAAERWSRGDDGPESQIARLADHRCSTCAWLLPIGGNLGQAFGVCAHDMSPSDGHVVALDHGCGAHSDVVAEPTPVPVTEIIIDDDTFLDVDMRAPHQRDEESMHDDESSSVTAEDIEAFQTDNDLDDDVEDDVEEEQDDDFDDDLDDEPADPDQ